MVDTGENNALAGAELAPALLEQSPTAEIAVEGASASYEPPRNAARELVEAFLRGRNPGTMRAYRADLEKFAVCLGLPDGETAARTLLGGSAGEANALALRFRTSQVEKGLGSAIINRRLTALRMLVKLARTLGMVNWELVVENLSMVAYRDTRGPGSAAVAAMLAAATARGDAKGLRDAAIVRLLHDCGMRRGEVISLDREHYSVLRGLYVLGKGRRAREWISLPPVTRAALEAWLHARGSAPGPLFSALDENHRGHRLCGEAIYMIVHQLGLEVGVETRPHGLRHTAITTALDKTNGNMREVQRFSRHLSADTLAIYDDARRDGGGKIAELVALPDASELTVACAAGHTYDKSAIGKFCMKAACKDGGYRAPARRIEWR